MAIKPGTRLGAYEVVSAAGSGGMGEVYKATDTRLNRTVAIKLLPHGLTANSELRSRLHREAQLIAALNHPHICVLHDVGQQDDIDYLVMEYLDGETLADRLNRGPLPLDQTLEYAAQIADALAKAHSQEIVHRDLKPGNIMLTSSGVKILDFGLAKLSPRVSIEASSHSAIPTAGAKAPLTAEGAILGTLHYMSPEQLEGKDADTRSDIFAFGAVLYEMLSGRKAFDGQSQASLIAAIMEREPSGQILVEKSTPAVLDRTLRKCLAKDPAKRWQSAADLQDQLLWIREHPTQASSTTTSRTRRPAYAAWSVAALMTLAAAALTYRLMSTTEIDQPLVRFPVDAPDEASFPNNPPSPFPAISFDGRQIVFTAGGKLWIRNLDSMDVRPLHGTETTGGAISNLLPFWSPDGRYIGFFSSGKLLKLDINGGPPQTLCAVTGVPHGGSWSPDGSSILFGGTEPGGIRMVPASGGEPKPVTALKQGELSHIHPSYLPDGRHFIFAARPGRGIFLANLDGGEPVEILKADSKAMFAPPGYLVFLREQTLMVQQLDLAKKAVIAGPTPVAEQIGTNSNNGRAAFSVSWNGVLVFRTGTTSFRKELVWYDRSGKETGKTGDIEDYRGIALSPDGARVAVHIHDDRAQGGGLWMLDVLRGGASKFSFKGHAADPVWSPDGKSVGFDIGENGGFQLYQKPSDGTGDDAEVLKAAGSKTLYSWSPDGKYLVYDEVNPSTRRDLWILPLAPEAKPILFLGSESNELNGQISPDGRWMAYQSDETDRPEVYIQPFDKSGGKHSVSTNGGGQPLWNRNGRELFFLEPGGRVMSATITVTGNALRVDVPKALFPARPAEGFVSSIRGYAVSADGQRFLITSRLQGEQTRPAPLTVILNWPKLLKP